MNKTCEITQDLLPLYCDGICSEASIEMVKEHLLECNECKAMLNNLENGSTVNLLKGEAGEIIRHHNRAVKKNTLTIAISIAAVLAIPLLVSLIISASFGKIFDWVFILLTSLLVVASITIVPIMVEMRKLFWTITSFTGCMLLLLLSCCIVSSGDWFFMVTISFLLGMSILFMPIILKQFANKNNFLNGKIAIISMMIDTLLVYATVITALIYANSSIYLTTALLITTFSILPVWFIFAAIRYTKFHALSKAGIATIVVGLFSTFTNGVINWLIGDGYIFDMGNANLSLWNQSNIDANIKVIILILFTLIGILLLAVGCILNKKKKT